MSEERTYTGPRGPNDNVNDPPLNQPASGASVLAIVGAVLAVILAFVAMWMANSADNHAGSVENKVTELRKDHDEFAKATIKKVNAIQVELARDATEITLLNAAVAKLQSKAEQSVVDQLSSELKGKASKASVQDLAAELLNKADARTVRKLSRRLDKYSTRLTVVEDIVLPKPAPEEPAPAPAAPPPPAASPAAAPMLGPGGRPETPAMKPQPLGSVGGKVEPPVKVPAPTK